MEQEWTKITSNYDAVAGWFALALSGRLVDAAGVVTDLLYKVDDQLVCAPAWGGMRGISNNRGGSAAAPPPAPPTAIPWAPAIPLGQQQQTPMWQQQQQQPPSMLQQPQPQPLGTQQPWPQTPQQPPRQQPDTPPSLAIMQRELDVLQGEQAVRADETRGGRIRALERDIQRYKRKRGMQTGPG